MNQQQQRELIDDDAFLVEVTRQHVNDFINEPGIVGFLGIKGDRTEVPDSELTRAKPFPAQQAVEVVDEASGVRSRLSKPNPGSAIATMPALDMAT
jgi:hypothetical protein